MSRKAKLLIGIVIAAVIAVAGIVLSVTVTGYMESKQELIVKNADDLEKAFAESTDKTVVLAKDIVYEGDLTLGVLNDFDLNGFDLTVKGDLAIKDENADGDFVIGKVDENSDVGTVNAESITLTAPKAHVEWSADVRITNGFSVSTSRSTFVFDGKFLTEEGETATEADITLVGGSAVIRSSAANVTYNIIITEGLSDGRVENATDAENTVVNIITSDNVTVAGKVNVTGESASVTVTAESEAEVSVSGTVSTVSGANDSKVTVSAGATVSGDITAGSVVNNGTVNGNVNAEDYSGSGNVGGDVSSKTDTTITANNVNVTYNGSAVTVQYTTNNKEGAATVTYYKGANKLTSAPVDAGEYTAVIAIASSENYNAAEKTVGITINKATPSVTAPTAKTLTYTGSAQALVNAGSTTGGTLVYSLSENGTYSATVPTATNAGSYTVYYKVNGDGNYNNVAVKSVTVTIAKAKVAKPVIDDNSFEYNGSEQGIAIAANDAYIVSGTTSATAVGSYSATVTLNSNYTWSDGSETVETYSWSITEGTAVVSTEEELRNAIADDGYSVVELGADIQITNSPVDIGEERTVTLDLNGQKITVPEAVDGRSLYALSNYGEFTVKDSVGNGCVSSRGIQNYGEMYMLGGRIESIDSNGGGAAIWNEGYFEMTGGTLAFTGNKTAENNVGSPFTNLSDGAALLTGGNITSDYTCIFAQGDSVLTVKNMTFESCTDYFMTVKTLNNSVVTMENVTINTENGGCIEAGGQQVTLINCNFTQTNMGNPQWNSTALAACNGGILTVRGGTYNGSVAAAYVYNSGGTINLESGTFVGETVALKADNSVSFFSSIINVSGGEYKGTFSIGNTKAELNITGGTFDSDPTAYVESGYKTVIKDNGASLSYTVVESGALVEDYDIAVYSDLAANGYKKVDVATVDGLLMLNDFADDMLGGQGYYVTLTKDIDLAASDLTTEDYVYIDQYLGYTLIPTFRGVFDGNNKTITAKYGLNCLIGVAYGVGEFKDITVKFTDTRASLTRVVYEFGFVLDETAQAAAGADTDKYYAKETKLGLKFVNVDYVAADDSYYDIGSGNRALYYNDTEYPYYYVPSSKSLSYAYVGNVCVADGSTIPAGIYIDGCDVTGNFVGGNHTSGAAIFSAGQIYGSDFTLTNSSFTGNFVGQYVGFVFANSSGIVDNRLTDSGDGNYVWDDGIVISGNTLNGTITSIGATNGSSLTFGNSSVEPAETGITVAEGAGGHVSKDSNITLTYGESYTVSSLTAEMETVLLQLKLGTLTCYESEGGARLTEASDYTLTVEYTLDGSETLDTGIVKVYPRTLEQAITDGIVTDENSVEWKTSASGIKYAITTNDGNDYVVIKANGIDQYFYAFTDNAMSKQSRATAFAFDANGVLVAMADCE